MSDVPSPRVLAEVARQIAEEASGLLRGALAARAENGATFELHAKSTPTDWVTEWDQATERLIRDRLGELRPGDGVLGEEEGDVAGSTGVRWVVDPIDGTTNFVYGLAPFAVSIAAEIEGVVVAGVVADVLHRETYVASLGEGATCNGRRIGVSGCSALPQALVATGFAYDPGRRARQAMVLAEVLPNVRDVRRSGAASVDLCWVAAGRLDGYWERGLGAWDFAAGAFVAAESGATVGDLTGGPASSEMTIAATPGIADDLRQLLTRSGAATA